MPCYPYSQFVYIRSNGKPELAVKVVRGPYNGVVIVFGKVELGEDKTFKYDYDILENPKNIQPDQQFFNDMADILIDITRLEVARKKNGWPSLVRKEWAEKTVQRMRQIV